ncbi:hypothetical protein KIW84_064895 [Lathyrus oleraceus]|uniref:Uncharacterized protein n=1 Tax=Pisum sativum TaxID=3888 RepID=A0A9D4WFB0_PEA|nr:hypothetical protein KIW84_064895 [Pisum sativum]
MDRWEVIGVFNCWFDYPEFRSFVMGSWNSFQVEGMQALVLKEKFKRLSQKLTVWNAEVFGRRDLKIKLIVKEFNDIEDSLFNEDNSPKEVLGFGRKILSAEFWKNMNLKESIIRHKFRILWLREGDFNTKFFHSKLKERVRQHSIISISLFEGGRAEDVKGVKDKVKRVFKYRFSKPVVCIPSMDVSLFLKFFEADIGMLEEPFSLEEIKDAIWNCEAGIGTSCGFFLEYRMWGKWMEVSVSSNSLSILVNESPADDFSINMFADDTIIIGKANWENLWSTKVDLREFKTVSGLKVNFFKSKLYGIHVKDEFLLAASHFLSCIVDAIPFKFHGIPVGSNPRRCVTLNPLLNSFNRKLSVWKSCNLSIGDRVVLLNSVLSSLSIFLMSFFKVPKKVFNDIILIQSRSLWNGNEDKKGIHWLKME